MWGSFSFEKRNGYSVLQSSLSFSPFSSPSESTSVKLSRCKISTLPRAFNGFRTFVISKLSSPFYLLLLWLCVTGLFTAYTFFRWAPFIIIIFISHVECIKRCRVFPRAPNLLLHMKRPPHLASKWRERRSLSCEGKEECVVCGKAGCKRHRAAGKRTPYLNVSKCTIYRRGCTAVHWRGRGW